MNLRDARLGTRRREHVAAWAALAFLLAVVGVVGSIWRPYAPALPSVATDLDAFDPAVLAAVDAYRAPRYLLGPASTLLGLLVPLWFVATVRGRARVRRWAGGATRAPLRAGAVAVGIAVITSLVTLPLAAWTRIAHDGRWGFRTQSAASWFTDWLLVSAGRWSAVGTIVVVLVVAVRRWPRSWPFRLTLLGTVVAALFVLVHPLVLQPLLLPTTPFPAGEHRALVEELLERSGDPDVPLYLGEASRRTTRVNAAVVGIGPTERIVVHDTLLELPPAQVASVVAHELAHREHADLPRGLLLGASGLLVALLLLRSLFATAAVSRLAGPRGASDPRLAAVLVAALVVLELLGTPIGNAVSRRVELAADARSLELTGDPEPLVRTTRTFTVRDLAAPEPPPLLHRIYGTHPSVGQRVRYAAAWADRHGVELPSREALADDEREVAHPAVREGPP